MSELSELRQLVESAMATAKEALSCAEDAKKALVSIEKSINTSHLAASTAFYVARNAARALKEKEEDVDEDPKPAPPLAKPSDSLMEELVERETKTYPSVPLKGPFKYSKNDWYKKNN